MEGYYALIVLKTVIPSDELEPLCVSGGYLDLSTLLKNRFRYFETLTTAPVLRAKIDLLLQAEAHLEGE